MKMITIAGNVGKTAEVRNTQNGQQVTGWTVAVDDGWGQNKSTLWFDCSWWGQRGEKVAPYIQKGGKITVSGELSKREHDGKTYLTINVNDVTLQSKSDQPNAGSTGNYDAPSGYGAGGNPNSGRDLGDEIPFKYSDL
ncbi:single-stranded DNA-binding protein [Sulfitobacter sp. 1A13353]|uniref:single-stranded DNA-binding protein n=1 Tax=Sulfitobacter sp. 1A13353 TaxID=3368568 RepID=UPI00374511BD